MMLSNDDAEQPFTVQHCFSSSQPVEFIAFFIAYIPTYTATQYIAVAIIMSDIAQILGGIKNAAPPVKPPPRPKGHHPSRASRMAAGNQALQALVGSRSNNKQDDEDTLMTAALPPIVPSFFTASSTVESQHESTTAVATTATTTTAQPTIKVGNKWIHTQKPARKWIWTNFASSARNDGLLLNHWVRAGVEYPDYPYAKFDVHLDPLVYTEEEYFAKLQHDSWTKSETDQLLELARIFELRWPVIYDRWFDKFHYRVTKDNNVPNESDNDDDNDEKQQQQQQQPVVAMVSRNIEDLQHRYYSVAAILLQHRIAQETAAEAKVLEGSTPDPGAEDPKEAADQLLRDTAVARTVAASDPKHQPLIQNIGTGSSNKIFDLAYEKERREHLEKMWHRSKVEEAEEANLRKELRLVETQLRKLKKTGGHIIAAADTKPKAGQGGGTASTSAASSRDASRAASPFEAPSDAMEVNSNAQLLDKAFASTAPVPTSGTPYLQSGRLAPPAIGGVMGLNKTLLARMESVLGELKVPHRPIPTKRVCDLYDHVRKDLLTLLTLQKILLQKEGQLHSKRVKYAKMGGTIQVADEDTALGIPKPKPPPPTPAPASIAAPTVAATTATTAGKQKALRTGKGKGISPPAAKGKSAAAKSAKGAAAAGDSGKAAAEGVAKQKPQNTKTKGNDTKSKSVDGKPKVGTGAATGGKSSATAGNKQAQGGKQALGGKHAAGKQAQKPSAKRKRKAEGKSASAASVTAAAAAVSHAGAITPVVAPTLKSPPVATAAAPKAAATVATGAAAPSPAVPETAPESKAPGKKRSRKS
jgi:DNA methyltransferase 1-associated protein 1